jgi:hypothetical protein
MLSANDVRDAGLTVCGTPLHQGRECALAPGHPTGCNAWT